MGSVIDRGEPGRASGGSRLTLCGSFDLVLNGNGVALPHSAERVLAFLALSNRAVSRLRVATNLWSDVPERRAANNLRTALWRLARTGVDLVRARDNRLQIRPELELDTASLAMVAKRLIHDPDSEVLAQVPLLLGHDELLPDWDDDWVVLDRERLRMLRLEALESAAAALLDRGELSDALMAASAVAQAEPSRDSARRLVVQVHLTRGNLVEALNTYRQYHDLLRAEYGVEPSVAMQRLLEPWHERLTAR